MEEKHKIVDSDDVKSAENGEDEEAGLKPKRDPINIILCSDGTGMKGGDGFETNVWRIFNYIDFQGHLRDKTLRNQIAFHDDGVGTQSNKIIRSISGATGWGLSKNVKRLYTDLVKNYQEGDSIYLFGFSRGAYTVRSLAGLISSQGILKVRGKDFGLKEKKEFGPEEIKKAIDTTYRHYKAEHQKRLFTKTTELGLLVETMLIIPDVLITTFWWMWHGVLGFFENKNYKYYKGEEEGGPKINIIGVWDTVGAIGVPVEFLRNIIDFVFRIDFHDPTLHDDVLKAYHALSIDDKRLSFHPQLWREVDNDERVEQVWFSGAHTNVGGGYAKDGLAYTSLRWMMEEIKADQEQPNTKGLRFVAGAEDDVAAKSNPHDLLYNSRKGFASYYSFKPRNIGKYAKEFSHSGIPKIHFTAFERIGCHTQGYAPGNIPEKIEVVPTKGDDFTEDTVDLSDELQKHYATKEAASSRKKGERWIFPRQLAYVLTIFSTVTLLWLMFTSPGSELDFLGNPITLVSSAYFNALIDDFELTALSSGLMVVSFVLRGFFKKVSEKSFGNYWWKADHFLPKG